MKRSLVLILFLYLSLNGSASLFAKDNSCVGNKKVIGAILKKYNQLGGCKSFLKAPKTNELPTPDGKGRFNHFEGGSIYWHPSTGAHEVHGAIKKKWAELGYERSLLGYPTTDERITPDGKGRFNHFQGGSIYWHPSTGAHEVHGAIKKKWAKLGYERSFLGYPTSDEKKAPGGKRFSKFQGGWMIYWSKATGAYIVHEEQLLLENKSPNQGAYKYLKKQLTRIRKEKNAPALAATVVANGKILAYAAVGKRKLGNFKRVTDHDLFAIGSVTKTLTSVLAGKLIQDHPRKLSWGTRVTKLFPELKGKDYQPFLNTTLSKISRMDADLSTMCLSHISCGTIKYNFTNKFDRCCQQVEGVKAKCTNDNLFDFRMCGRDEFVHKLLKQPKEESRYNNNAPVVLSGMIQRAFNRNYENLLSEKILFPLNAHARFASDISKTEANQLNFPLGHDEENIPVNQFGSDNVVYHIGHASGGMMMSPRSMGLYLTEMLEKSSHRKGLLNPISFKQLLGGQGEFGRTNSGWYVSDLQNVPNVPNWVESATAYTHNGALLGYRSDFWFAPEENFGFAVATTGEFNAFDELRPQLIAMNDQRRILSYFQYVQLSHMKRGENVLFDGNLLSVWRAPATNYTLEVDLPTYAQRLTNLAIAYPKDRHHIKVLKVYVLQQGRYKLIKTINPSRPNNTVINFPKNLEAKGLKLEFENESGKRTRLTELLVKYQSRHIAE